MFAHDSHHSLKLSFTNIWGLRLNFVDCEFFFESNSPDVLALCETNLADSIDSGNFSVRGYPQIYSNTIMSSNILKYYNIYQEGSSLGNTFYLSYCYLCWWYFSPFWVWSGIWSEATTWIGFWTWIWSTRHYGQGQQVACWSQCWKNSTGFI